MIQNGDEDLAQGAKYIEFVLTSNYVNIDVFLRALSNAFETRPSHFVSFKRRT